MNMWQRKSYRQPNYQPHYRQQRQSDCTTGEHPTFLQQLLHESGEEKLQLEERIQQLEKQIKETTPAVAYAQFSEEFLKLKTERDSLQQELDKLRDELSQSNMRMSIVELTNAEENPGDSYSDLGATLSLMEKAIDSVIVAADAFAFNYIREFGGRKLFADIAFAKESHRRYGLQALISTKLFSGFENESFGLRGGCAIYLDVKQQQHEYFKDFRKFDILEPHEALADSLFSEYYNLNMELVNEITLFNEKLEALFCNAAKAIWALHKLAMSFNPRATTYFPTGTL